MRFPAVLDRTYYGDSLEELKKFPDEFFSTCVTSPPYWGLRDYGNDGIGTEDNPDEYVLNVVNIFREVRRTLRRDGTLWLNIGDTYAAKRGSQSSPSKWRSLDFSNGMRIPRGLKNKDLIGVPWRVALALQADGWYLRSDVIWSKPNAMPERVKDRPVSAHEYVFLLSRESKYYYDYESIGEERADGKGKRRKRSVWEVSTGVSTWSFCTSCNNFKERGSRNKGSFCKDCGKESWLEHFAQFPIALITPCILAGSKNEDVVLDPFAGSGTTGIAAVRMNRRFIGIDMNRNYVNLANARILLEKTS